MNKWQKGPWEKNEDGWCYEGDVFENQDLISAAPELYEALEVFVNDYVSMVNSGDCGNWNPEEELKVTLARAALRKARGEA